MKSLDKIQLKLSLKLHNYLYRRVSALVVKLNNGIHPKHNIMKYHQFFIDNISENSNVLDIGCGIGAVTYDIAKKAKRVVGIDNNYSNIEIAKKRYNSQNIDYICEDATRFKIEENFEYIVLSNVLEHIKDRIDFLNKIKVLSKYILIRVPMINRSWLTLYKKEIGMEYRLDSSHYIEYTLETFINEFKKANLEILSYSVQFGEIWAKIAT